MANWTSAAAAKEYADRYITGKVFSPSVAQSATWTDEDPGGTGPTDPSPPPDDPTENEVEQYIRDRHKFTLAKIRQAVDNA